MEFQASDRNSVRGFKQKQSRWEEQTSKRDMYDKQINMNESIGFDNLELYDHRSNSYQDMQSDHRNKKWVVVDPESLRAMLREQEGQAALRDELEQVEERMRNKVMIDPKHFMGAMADLPYALAKTSELF